MKKTKQENGVPNKNETEPNGKAANDNGNVANLNKPVDTVQSTSKVSEESKTNGNVIHEEWLGWKKTMKVIINKVKNFTFRKLTV